MADEPMAQKIVTLTTDFGPDSHYVAAMKGALLRRCPDACLVDVCHAVRPQDVQEGAWILENTVREFPAGTCHLAVIDPGVGTPRQILAVRAAEHLFVAPDNGLLSGILAHDSAEWIRRVEFSSLGLASPSSTFHGRDIMAPAAAWLVNGSPPEGLGPLTQPACELRSPVASMDHEGHFRCQIVMVDSFGNLITNLHRNRLERLPRELRLVRQGIRIEHFVETYGDSKAGTLVGLFGSNGDLEISVVNGNAAQQLSAGTGDAIDGRVDLQDGE